MLWLAIAGGVFLVWLVLVFLFTPAIPYHLSRRTSVSAHDFLYTLQSTCQAALHHGNRITILTDGPTFYPAMLEAIRGATRSVNMECYIFHNGRVGEQFIEALSERARAGVIVTIVIDAIGSFGLWGRPVARLRAAGCRDSVVPGRPLVFALPHQQPDAPRAAHRRRIDGVRRRRRRRRLVGVPAREAIRPWRDTMARIEGPVVAAMQGVAAENWLECCGEILTGPRLLSGAAPARRHDGVRGEELAVGSRDRLARDVSAADRGSRSGASASARRISCPTVRSARALVEHGASAASRSR